MEQKKFDCYQMVTDKIVALLEKGLIPWAKPWTSGKSIKGPINAAWSHSTGEAYSLLNQMMLADPEKDYKTIAELMSDVCGEWLTFKQVQEVGGKIKKGAKGRPVVFFKPLEVEDKEHTDEDGNPKKKTIPILKYYTVFKLDQTEGVNQKYHNKTTEETPEPEKNKTAEEIKDDYLKHYGIKLNHVAGDRAYYSPMLDCVVLPKREQFKGSTEYYETLFHELTHSTGHESRLNRLKGVAAFGDEVYSTEELVAEIGAASILATLGMSNDKTLNNSAAYIQSWLKALKNDKKMIVVASARAEKALDMILNA